MPLHYHWPKMKPLFKIFQKFFTCSKGKPWQQDDSLQNFMQPKLQAAIIETTKRTEFVILPS